MWAEGGGAEGGKPVGGGHKGAAQRTWSAVRVTTLTPPATAHRLLRASPRKPKVDRDVRSPKSDILEVWYLRVSAW